MNTLTTSTAIPTRALKLEALSKMSASFELFCLASGMEALGKMMDRDAQTICGPRHARGRDRRAFRHPQPNAKMTVAMRRPDRSSGRCRDRSRNAR